MRLGPLGRWWDAPGSGWNHGPSETVLMGMNRRIHSRTWACQSLKQDDLARKELQGSWTRRRWRSEEAEEQAWTVSRVGCSESTVTCGCQGDLDWSLEGLRGVSDEEKNPHPPVQPVPAGTGSWWVGKYQPAPIPVVTHIRDPYGLGNPWLTLAGPSSSFIGSNITDRPRPLPVQDLRIRLICQCINGCGPVSSMGVSVTVKSKKTVSASK